MLLDAVDFWIEPSSGRSVAFLLAFAFLGGIIILVQIAHRHWIRTRWEAEFLERLRDTGILGKPEETVLRDLVDLYKIAPPAQILSSLTQYDDVASQEILRVETAVMPLADRIDRIEYLYSIRIQAFAEDPAIGGAGVLLPKESRAQPVTAGAASPPLMMPLEAEGGTGPDLSLLFADLGAPGEPNQPPTNRAE